VMMEMGDRATVVCEISYASRMEHDRFPERSSSPRVTKARPNWAGLLDSRDHREGHACPALPAAPVSVGGPGVCECPCIHCELQRGHAAGSPDRAEARDHVEDNLKTLRLVFGAYESARTGQAVLPG